MRSTPLVVRALALILCLSLAYDAGAVEIARVVPAAREGAAAPEAAALGAPAAQISATLGPVWNASVSETGSAQAAGSIDAAAPGSEAAAALARAAAPVAASAQGARQAAAPAEATRAAAERVPAALEKAAAAFRGPAGPADLEPKTEPQKREPLVRLVRPKVSYEGTAAAAIDIPEPASKLVADLRRALLEDREAGVTEATRLLMTGQESDGPHVVVRAHAARTVAEHAGDQATGILARALAAEKNWHVRRELSLGLGTRAGLREPGRDDAVAALTALLDDANDSVHLMAHWALRQFGVETGPERPLKVEKPAEPKPPTRMERLKNALGVAAVLTVFLGPPLGIGGYVIWSASHMQQQAQQQTTSPGKVTYHYESNGNPEFPMLIQVPDEPAPAKDAAAAAASPSPAPSAAPKAAPKAPDAMTRIADAMEAQLILQAKQAADAESGRFMTMYFMLVLLLLGIGGPIISHMLQRRASKGGGATKGAAGMLKAKANTKIDETVRFSDLAGIENAMGTMSEIVDYQRNPAEFKARGGKVPRGVLLVGPPGTGKTAIARALAHEAGVPFFSIAGSDFVEMFVGVGAARVRDLFEQAKEAGRAIIFIDEIDALGRARGGHGGGNEEREQALNQLLVEMDGFSKNQDITLIGATNRADVLDPALRRPGRFDREVQVEPADVVGREAILERWGRYVPLAPDVDLKNMAERSPGRSGAYLKNFLNEAALNATKYRRRAITAKDADVGLTRAIIGDENPTILSEADRKRVSKHEAGHVFAGRELNKVTIVRHGRALGYAEPAEELEKVLISENAAMKELVILMGGRVAEEIAFGSVEGEASSSGADNDLERATELARLMVERWGMSKKVGYMQTAPSQKDGPYAQSRTSERTKALVDAEVGALLQKAHDLAEAKLRARWDRLEAMSDELLKHETLYRQDIERYTKAP